MKRSEMLNIIEKALSYNKHLYTKKQFAKFVLDDIQKAGMAPPRIKGAYELWGFNPYTENNYWEEEQER